MPDTRYTIREMCEEFGVTPRTLRYYEYIELIAPERDGQKRLYTARDRGRLKLILRGRRFGFPLEAIRQWLELYDRAGYYRQIEAWVANATQRLAELEAERAQLDEKIAELRNLRQEGCDWLEANRNAAAE
ncbi:MAG TPA: MerR family DNA-binding transcriptional regulator [Paracoccaceae bacterium]|nr:MerR family DNA-binding transcriptional regulator [Paracoccaceae bacterium]